VALLAAAGTAGCDKTFEITSVWRDRPVVVDGANEDWEGVTRYLDDAKVSVGVMNDAESAHVNLVFWEPGTIAQIVGGGLTIWFDPAGGKEKTLGIRHPVGASGASGQGQGPGGLATGGPPGRPEGAGGRDSTRAARVAEMLAKAANEMEVLGPHEFDRREVRVDEHDGIDVAARMVKGALVYELTVPLAQASGKPFAVGGAPGGLIGIGLETAEMTRPDGPPGGRGGGSGMGGPGGMPGGGRGGPGGGGPGGGGPGGGGERPEPLKVWAKVQLSAGAAAPAAELAGTTTDESK
jgi:hypothetical protein